MSAIIIIAASVSAVATAVIAWHAVASHKLASKIQTRDDEFREQISDLYEAIILSVFIAPEVKTTRGSTLEGRIRIFNQHYKGKTEIF